MSEELGITPLSGEESQSSLSEYDQLIEHAEIMAEEGAHPELILSAMKNASKNAPQGLALGHHEENVRRILTKANDTYHRKRIPILLCPDLTVEIMGDFWRAAMQPKS